MPNLNDKKLSFKFFYRENIDFNFIKVLGYEFKRDINNLFTNLKNTRKF